LSGLEVGTTSICNSLSITFLSAYSNFLREPGELQPQGENLVFLLDGQGTTRKILHTTLAFVSIGTLTLMTLQTWACFINEVSRTVPTTFKLKKYPGQWHGR
jgi:hypothetical protein